MNPLFLLLAIIPAGIGLAVAFGKKRTMGGPDVPDPERSMLTGTAGDYVYQVEATGNQGFKWAVTGPNVGAGAEDKVEATIRAAFGFVLPMAGESASVTGALGPYTFTVSLDESGEWHWIASDLGGGGAASAEQGTMGSRGAAIIRALQWLVERGAADWLAAPKSLPEGPVGGGTPQPKKGLAPGGAPPSGKPAVGKVSQIEGMEIFPGLVVTEQGTAHLVDTKKWHAYARPRIDAVKGVDAVVAAVFGEEPGPNIKFNGVKWTSVRAKLADAVAKVNQPNYSGIPSPDEWLANLIVGYYPTYKGASTTYKNHVIVAIPTPGAPKIASWAWAVWKWKRGENDAALTYGVGSSATDALKIAKKRVDAMEG